MDNAFLAASQQSLRGTDSNSLLRLYDQAQEMFQTSPLQNDRVRADKAIQRITKELQRRNVPFRAAIDNESLPK